MNALKNLAYIVLDIESTATFCPVWTTYGTACIMHYLLLLLQLIGLFTEITDWW